MLNIQTTLIDLNCSIDYTFYVGVCYLLHTSRRVQKTLAKIETQEKDAMCKNVTALRDTEKVLFCGLTE